MAGGSMRQRQDSLFPTDEKVNKGSLTCVIYFIYKYIFLIRSSFKAKYDAWEMDIAVMNIFFGKETVIGHIFSLSQYLFHPG